MASLEQGLDEDQKHTMSPPPLTAMNYVSLGAYLVNFVTTYMSFAEVFGPSNSELSAKYQTLVTPIGTAFSIWSIIFIGEAVFAIGQMLPAYRNHPILPHIEPWWLCTCLFQTAWNYLFASEAVLAAAFAITCVFISLMVLVVQADKFLIPLKEELLLRTTFSFHCGWLLAATVVNWNVYYDFAKAEPATLLAVAAFTLTLAFSVALLTSVYIPRPDPLIALVLGWACWWIHVELQDPKKLLSKTRFNPHEWSSITTDGFSLATRWVSVCCLVLAAIATVLRLAKNKTMDAVV